MFLQGFQIRDFYFIMEKWFIASKINHRVRREHRALTLSSVYSVLFVVSQTRKSFSN